MKADRNPILEEAVTCWRLAAASRAAVLVDGADYFRAAREAILRAQRSIFVIGWDIHGEADLLPGEDSPDDGAPTRLRPLLNHVVAERSDLRVHVLLWDYPAFYAFEREVLPSLSWRLHTAPRVEICLDDNLPLGACHHQKLLVVDDTVAFTGGIDLTIRRWDTRAHELVNTYRVDPTGGAYEAFHDVQMIVEGEAARALGDVARDRWHAATGSKVPSGGGKDCWPAHLEPEFQDLHVGVARTSPGMFNAPQVREIEALYVRAIKSARRLIYIENQYLTAEAIAEALIDRLQQVDELEAIILSPPDAESWLETQSMGVGRRRFMKKLREHEVGMRVRVLCPYKTAEGRDMPVFIHAKMMAVDDRFLLVGSANLNNRSMGFDTECCLAIEARSEAERGAVAGVRNGLIAEHTGSRADEVATALADCESAFQALEDLVREGHALTPVVDGDVPSEEVAALSRYLADPDMPLENSESARGLYGAGLLTISWKQRLVIIGVALAVLGLALAWNTGPLADYADPERLRPWLDSLRGTVWTPLVVLAVYLVGSAVVFPITVLIVVTSLTFGPWMGFTYALAGSLVSAAVTFEVGALVGRANVRKVMGRRLNRISRALARQGVISVAIIRLLPIAPFSLINLVAGASHIQLRDFFFGTLFGMTPGIVILTAMGDAIRRVWENPDLTEIVIVVGVLGVWFAFGILVQRFVARRSRQDTPEKALRQTVSAGG